LKRLEFQNENNKGGQINGEYKRWMEDGCGGDPGISLAPSFRRLSFLLYLLQISLFFLKRMSEENDYEKERKKRIEENKRALVRILSSAFPFLGLNSFCFSFCCQEQLELTSLANKLGIRKAQQPKPIKPKMKLLPTRRSSRVQGSFSPLSS
jgi:hypothetical protein